MRFTKLGSHFQIACVEIFLDASIQWENWETDKRESKNYEVSIFYSKFGIMWWQKKAFLIAPMKLDPPCLPQIGQFSLHFAKMVLQVSYPRHWENLRVPVPVWAKNQLW